MDVSKLLAEQKDDPVVLNFAQNREYTGNYLVGTLLPPEKLPDKVHENPDTQTKNGLTKQVVYWKANDATTRDENEQVQRDPILKENLLPIGPGVVSPRKVYILMPDKFTEIPDEFTRPTNSANPEVVEKLGSFFAQFYRYRRLEKSLRIVAESEPEMYDKIENLVKNSSLDDDLLDKHISDLERLKDMADSGGKSDSEN